MIEFGQYRYDSASQVLYRDGDEIPLPPRVARVLELLLERRGAIASKEELIERAWPGAFVTEDSLTQAVSQLRQLLGDDPQRPTFVETVPRRGYRFIAEISGPADDNTESLPSPTPRLPPSTIVGDVRLGDAQSDRIRRMAASRPLALIAATLVVGLLIGALPMRWWSGEEDGAGRAMNESFIDIGAGLRLSPDARRRPIRSRPTRDAFDFSPADPHRIVYSAVDEESGQVRLYLQALGQTLGRVDATPIPNTGDGYNPVFSPDGSHVAYAMATRDSPHLNDGLGGVHDLRRVAVDGSGDALICRCFRPGSFGITWGDDDTIVLAGEEHGGLMRVSAFAGEHPVPITRLNTSRGETSHRLPHMLPGSNAVLFTVVRGRDWRRAEVAVYDFESDTPTVLIEDATDARYIDGRLLFARRGELWSVAFDPATLRVSGQQARVLEDVMHAIMGLPSWASSGAAQFAVSSEGTLAYVPGGVHPEAAHSLEIVEDGVPTRLAITTGAGEAVPRGFAYPRVSPTEPSLLAYSITQGFDSQIWLWDLDAEEPRLLTPDGVINLTPVWSHDGERIAFYSERDTGNGIYQLRLDGTEDTKLLVETGDLAYVSAWSQDGTLALVKRDGRGHKVVLYPPGEAPRQLEGDPHAEMYPSFSPDNNWLLYSVTPCWGCEPEIWARPWPSLEPATMLRLGERPAWSRDGRAIYFEPPSSGETSRQMAVVDVAPGDSISVGDARMVFEGEIRRSSPVRTYDVLDNGRLVILTRAPELDQPVTRIRLIEGWLAALK